MANTHENLTGPKIELCIYCGEPTGFVGKGEDSLYLDNTGPWCQECYEIARFAVEKVRVQINQQEQRRTEILRIALNTIWTKPITEQLAHEIAGAALAEWGATDGH